MSRVLLSILIPTLEERHAQFARLHETLRTQIDAASMQDRIEVLELCDNREQSLGAKRNVLLERARGEFVAFVDDDDAVANNYVALICKTLEAQPETDCLGITGLVYFRGAHRRRFVYSLEYDHYFSRGGVYYRPPYILNPMRRALARVCPFTEVSLNEDQLWAMDMVRAKALKRQVMLDEILYHYYSRRRYAVQWAIDATEPVRHPLGLKFANRLRVRRWLAHFTVRH